MIKLIFGNFYTALAYDQKKIYLLSYEREKEKICVWELQVTTKSVNGDLFWRQIPANTVERIIPSRYLNSLYNNYCYSTTVEQKMNDSFSS